MHTDIKHVQLEIQPKKQQKQANRKQKNKKTKKNVYYTSMRKSNNPMIESWHDFTRPTP